MLTTSNTTRLPVKIPDLRSATGVIRHVIGINWDVPQWDGSRRLFLVGPSRVMDAAP